jgi:hypothetical protein
VSFDLDNELSAVAIVSGIVRRNRQVVSASGNAEESAGLSVRSRSAVPFADFYQCEI